MLARRRACQTMARNIADISGTSNSSPQSCSPANASKRIEAPVPAATAASTRPVTLGDQTRNPYSSVRLIHMRWKGIVSHDGQAIIAARHVAASAPQASSMRSGRDAVARISHRLDRVRAAELLAQPSYADVDDVRSRVEAVAPDLREQPLAADDLPRVRDEVVEQPELAVGQVDDTVADLRLTAHQVELERPRADPGAVRGAGRAAQVHADARHELVERERLREVVVGPEVEAPQLRGQLGTCREDEHREVGPRLAYLGQQAQAVDARQQQVEDDELVRSAERELEPCRPVLGGVDHEPLGLEPQPEEIQDPRLVLDDENPHPRPGPYKRVGVV